MPEPGRVPPRLTCAFVAAVALAACGDEASAPAVDACAGDDVIIACRGEGETCVSDYECAPGLSCNHGALPEDLATGRCLPPAAEGGVCGYTHASELTLGRALEPEHDGIDRGDCDVGLLCAPTFPAAGTDEAPPICDDAKGVPCFFSGACRPAGSLVLGAPCARSEACDSGVCAVFEEPLAVIALPGFDAAGKWIGPHVGRCVSPEDAIATCGRGLPCAAGFTCLDRQCIPPHTQRPGEVCSVAGGTECAFGLVCDGRTCLRR